MLAEGLGDPTRVVEYARRIASEADRLGRVVSNVLRFTRLERGSGTVSPTPGDIGAVVSECVSRQRQVLETAGVTLDLHLAPDLPGALFDAEAVTEILANLLDNAEKHTRGAADRQAGPYQ